MVSFFVCGDIVCGEDTSPDLCSTELVALISSADFSVCNLEGPTGGCGSPQPKIGPHLSQAKGTIDKLTNTGFDLLLLANNHVMDFGHDALRATLEEAAMCGLDTIGAGLTVGQAYRPFVKQIYDLRIGMINACEAQFGVVDDMGVSIAAGYAWINHPVIDQMIIELRQNCDIVIVFSHAGLENFSIPQKEWRDRYRHFCELGADVVIGSHPHVPQGYEIFNNALIFYSLGNFYFDYSGHQTKEDPSYSILLEFRKGKPPTFKTFCHYKKKGRVRLSEDTSHVDLGLLCSLLDKPYARLADSMSTQAYEHFRRHLLLSLFPLPYDGSVIGSIRRLVAQLRGHVKKIDRDLLQFHLLRNESYYFAARHALKIKTIEKCRGQFVTSFVS